MKKFAIDALLSAFTAAPAFADDTGKFYGALDLGKATYNNVSVAVGTYPDPRMFRIAGGYHYSSMLAAEVGFSKFGDSVLSNGTTSATLTASSLHIAAVGTYPVSSEFDLIGKLGLTRNQYNLDTPTNSFNNSQNDLLVGLGAQYNYNSLVSVRVQFDKFGNFGNFANTKKVMEVSAISAGMIFNF